MASSTLLLLQLTLLCFSSLAFEAHKTLNGPGPAQKPIKLPFHLNFSLTATLSIGTPPQPATMVLDTGSELTWLHCKKSANVDSIFEPARSKSYSPVRCGSPVCENRAHDPSVPATCDQRRKLCRATVTYADASSMEGDLASETFEPEGSKVPDIVFGCMDSGHDSSAKAESKITGLMGLNRGSLSFVTQKGYSKFSYCIPGQDHPGALYLGEAHLKKPLSYTPMVKIDRPLPNFDRNAYTVGLEGIKVGSKVLPIPKTVLQPDHTGAGQTMIDSGTQFTFILGQAYEVLKKEFVAQTKGVLTVLGDDHFVFQGAMDLCFRVPSTQNSFQKLPTVTLMFSGAELGVSGERLLYRVPGETRGSDTVQCFTFGNSDLVGIESFIIGNYHQQNMWMEFDLANSRIGLAEAKCDEAGEDLESGL